MTEGPPPARPISPEEREGAVQRLCTHFARDHIDTRELERRLDLVFAAAARDELAALEQDLPALPVEEPAAIADTPGAAARVPVDATRRAREREFLIGVMGGTERTGNWTPARHVTVLALMGGALLDFREATFAEPVTSVTIFAVMGGVEIVVPPGVRVESHGIAIMGGFAGTEPARPPAPDAPLIRLHGLALMGGVDVKERLPGESEREARRRLKAERRARARLLRGGGG
ncbi:MAG: DUF1707 domain-containing protein, partial [Gemmatimonadota bacterium]